MDEDTDMAYGRVQGTYQGTVTFEEKRDIEKEEENLEKYDFDNPIESRLTHFRRLERLTVLGALYRKSLFTDNNIRFNEKQTYFSDTKVLVQLLNNAKNIKSNEESVYVKRHHNDKAKNPAISQFTREETMPDYFVAY